MQVICGSPLMVRPDPATTLGQDDSEIHFKLPTSDRMLNRIRLSATKPDIGTPMRVPVDSNGQRLCPTPKSARALDFGSSDLKWHTNPAFQPLESNEIPAFEQSQPLNVLIESNGQKPCPTPKSMSYIKPRIKSDSSAANSPGDLKLRFQKPLHFEPMETISSPSVRKEQVPKRVLGDSNGQWAQGTTNSTKRVISSNVKTTASGTSNFDSMTPRNLFNESTRSNSRIKPAKAEQESSSTNTLKESPKSPDTLIPGLDGEATCASASLVRAPGSRMKKRGRDGDNVTECDENMRTTRSKAEAERIAVFLKSPAVRVRLSDGTRQEYQGTPRKLALKLLDTAEKDNCCAPGQACGEAVSMGAKSSHILDEGEKLPAVADRLSTVDKISFHFPLPSSGVPPRTPLSKFSNKKIAREISTPAITASGGTQRPSTKQGSAKKNLSLLL